MKRGAIEAATLATMIVVGLWLDQHVAWGQVAVNVVVWAWFVHRVWRADRDGRVVLLACLGFATLGECFLSLVWGLYDYRVGNLPLFVPPGHALLFELGRNVARRIDPRAAWLVPLGFAPVVAWLAITGRDMLGVPLFGLLLLSMRRERSRSLCAAMFVLALVMEVYGTLLGNWTWRATVPWLGWSTTNPPLAAGAFYCVLDALVMLVTRPGRRAGNLRG